MKIAVSIFLYAIGFGLLCLAGYYAHLHEYGHATFDLVLGLANFHGASQFHE